MTGIPDGPLEIIWDITYACPLRCTHCYSESGRRPTRQLGHDDLLRVADAIAAMRPVGVSIAGGEPLVVPRVFDVVRRLTAGGAKAALFTGGWPLRDDLVDEVADTFFRVSVSVDGATPEVHDRIRGRRGSFQRALDALGRLDGAAADVCFGIDFVVVRSNIGQLERLCADVASRFPRLSFVSFGAAIPEGLASRAGFAEHELLDDDQVALLGDRALAARLRDLVPPSVQVTTSDNLALRMDPERIRRGAFFPALQIEPDGEVRAMPAYEGSVGNVLTDSPKTLWRRAVQRWHDPFVVETLAPVRTMREWAAATRAIDRRFGTDADRARLDRRPEFVPAAPVGGATGGGVGGAIGGAAGGAVALGLPGVVAR